MTGKNKRSSFENYANPYDTTGTRTNERTNVYENLGDAKIINLNDFEELLTSLKQEEDNECRIHLLSERKIQFLFTSKNLIELLNITPSVKTRIQFVKEVGPRLIDPKSLSVTIIDMFRYSEEKRKVEMVLKSRAQVLAKQVAYSQGVAGNSNGNCGVVGGRGRGAGRGGGGGRGRGRGRGGGRGSGTGGEGASTLPTSSVPLATTGNDGHVSPVKTTMEPPGEPSTPPSSATTQHSPSINQQSSPVLKSSPFYSTGISSCIASPARVSLEVRPLELRASENSHCGGYGAIRSEGGLMSPSIKSATLVNKNGVLGDMGSIANIMCIILTCNMFSFPWSFYETGLCYGTLILVASASVSCITALSLHRSQQQVFLHTGEVTNYCEIVQHFLGGGWWWSSSIQIATAISCFGGCVGFYIFMGQILSQLLEISLPVANALLLAPLIFLALSRSFKEMSIYTNISVISFILVILVMYQYAFVNWYTASISDHILPKHDSLHNVPEGKIVVEFIGNATFLFAIHYCLLSQFAEDMTEDMRLASLVSESSSLLDRRSTLTKTSGTHITVSFVLSTMVSILIGVTGHLFAKSGVIVRDHRGHVMPGCEDGVCENVILNIPSGILKNITNSVLIVSTMISYALLLAPAREYIESIVMISMLKTSRLSSMGIYWSVNLLRVVMVLTTAVIATEAPYFADVLAAVGGITDSYLAYILPALIMITVLSRQTNVSYSQRVMCPSGVVFFFYFVLLWGIVLMVSTLWGLLSNIDSTVSWTS